MPTSKRPATPCGPDRPRPGWAPFAHAAVLAAALLAAPAAALAAGLAGSPHDVTRSGASLCELCHLPIRTASEFAFAPLWDHGAADARFGVFGLPIGRLPAEAMERRPWPGAATRLCLGCHDGLSASLVLGPGERSRARHHVTRRARDFTGGYVEEIVLPPPLGRGVIDEHPVFVPYPMHPLEFDLNVPPTPDGWPDVRLVAGRVECISCHDVHNTRFRPFLRRSNAGSGICLTCHRK